MKAKKMPTRTCIVCRSSDDKRNLVRIVRTTEGKIVYDSTGKLSGRGAYLCKKLECIEKGLSGKQVVKALNCEISSNDLLALKEALHAAIG